MAVEELKTCYTCLQKVTSLTDLLDEDSDNITFVTKLSKFCTIEVIPEVVGICSACLSQLRVSYKFLDNVTTSQEVWKNYFSEINPKTEEIVIVNDAEHITYEIEENSLEIEEAENSVNEAEHITYEIDENSSELEEAENSSCYNHPSNHDDHHDSDSKPRKENDSNFKCANCSKIFLAEEFLFHGCFRDMQNNVDKSNDNNRNIEPEKDTDCKKKVLHACINCRKLFATKLELQKHASDCYELKKVSTEQNPQCRNNVDYNSFMCARCLKVFSYKELLLHGCFKSTHSKVKSNSRELKKAKETESDSQCGNKFDDNNFECAKCLKVFSDEEFLFHGCFKGTQNTVDKFNNHDRNIKPKIDTNSEKKVSHSCTICRKLFTSKLKLQKHITHFHESKEVANIELNSQCKNEFDTDSSDSQSDLNIFKCVQCSKVFSGEEFILHDCFESSQPYNNNTSEKSKVETKLKKEKTYECITCEKSFGARFQLDLHLLRAHNGNRYKCDLCDKDFKKSLHLKQHLTLHTGRKYFSCEICNKEFRLMSAKQRHMKMHTMPLGERTKKTPFLCNICGRHFPFSNGYQRHMSIHLGIKRHECKVCNRRFRESTHLKVHMRTHTGEKPYMCDVCGQAFSIRASLLKHIDNIHNNQKHIGKIHKYNNQKHIGNRHKHKNQKHIGNIHNNKSESPNFNFMCRFCGENFSGDVELYTHIGSVHSDENIYLTS